VSRDDEPQLIDDITAAASVVYTYDVIWVQSDVPWSRRWDIFLTSGGDEDIHWFSIINSVMIVLFLTGMIAMILVREPQSNTHHRPVPSAALPLHLPLSLCLSARLVARCWP